VAGIFACWCGAGLELNAENPAAPDVDHEVDLVPTAFDAQLHHCKASKGDITSHQIVDVAVEPQPALVNTRSTHSSLPGSHAFEPDDSALRDSRGYSSLGQRKGL
jgi:hypothetical protein